MIRSYTQLTPKTLTPEQRAEIERQKQRKIDQEREYLFSVKMGEVERLKQELECKLAEMCEKMDEMDEEDEPEEVEKPLNKEEIIHEVLEEVMERIELPEVLHGKDADEEGITSRVLGSIKLPEVPKHEEIVKDVLSQIKVKNGKDGKSTKPEEVLELLKEEQLEIENIKGLKSHLIALESNKNTWRGGGDTVVAGSNITITRNSDGNAVITASSGLLTATGTVDGSNTIFTFTSTPNTITVDGGRRMRATSSDGTVNWTIAGLTVTLSIAPNFDIFGD